MVQEKDFLSTVKKKKTINRSVSITDQYQCQYQSELLISQYTPALIKQSLKTHLIMLPILKTIFSYLNICSDYTTCQNIKNSKEQLNYAIQ